MAAVKKGETLQQLLIVWNALDGRRRFAVGAATAGIVIMILLLARVANNPSMALLYSGLDPSASGEVITALEQTGTRYSVRGNSIFVPSDQRDVMRMTLAEQGLPATSTAGYELLDTLTGFGTTAQMFDAAYWRAREGELARTILAWPQIKSARVHIANPVAKPFSKVGVPVASVTVKMTSGALSRDRVRALRFLVASAVAGLSPDDVSIIDSDHGLMSAGDAQSSAENAGNERAVALKNNVERLLTARVGPGNVVVEVTIDTILDRETIVERRFDPDNRVAVSTDTEEVSTSATDGGNGQVTVASNLPDGDATKGGDSSKSTNSETRERVNYEVSETTRELIKSPGTISRISVAALVNGITSVGSDGRSTWSARSADELQSLSSLIQSAIGFSESRGDVVTIKSLEFPAHSTDGTVAENSVFAGLAANTPMLLQTGLLALVVLGLGMFVVRPILTAEPKHLLSAPEIARLDDPDQSKREALNAEGSGQTILLGEHASDDPVAQLRKIISERQEESIEVLRNWIDSSNEPA